MLYANPIYILSEITAHQICPFVQLGGDSKQIFNSPLMSKYWKNREQRVS